jgi:hypothetical protein
VSGGTLKDDLGSGGGLDDELRREVPTTTERSSVSLFVTVCNSVSIQTVLSAGSRKKIELVDASNFS